MNRSGAAFLLVLAASSLIGCSGASDQERIDAAKAALQKNDSAAALIHLKGALADGSTSAEVRYLMGKTLLAGGDAAAALVELNKARELQAPDDQVVPELARAMLATGEQTQLIAQHADWRLSDPAAIADVQTSVAIAFAARGDSVRARAATQAALQAQPGHAPAIVVNARLMAAEGEFDDALLLLGQVLAQEPAHEAAGLLRGEVLKNGKNDAAAALEAFRSVAAAHPKSLVAHTEVLALLMEQGKTAEARRQLDELKKSAPNHPLTLYHEAQLAFADREFKRSREITDRALKVIPDNSRVLELAGAAEFAMGHHAQAEHLLGKALKGTPGLVRARAMLAESYLRTRQPDKALVVLDPVLKSGKADGGSLSLAAEAWMQTGEVKKAQAAFQAAAKLAPSDARVRTKAAEAQLAAGGTGAMAELQAVATADTGTRADIALISAYWARNDLNGALRSIDGLQRKLPDEPLAYHLRGRVLLAKGDSAGAAQAFGTALSKAPHYFPAITMLAAIDRAAGRPEAARQRFEELAKAQPKNYLPWLALAESTAREGGSPSEVLKHIRSAVAASPDEVAPNLSLIANLLAVGDTKAALAAAQVAAAALPNDLDILEALGRAQLAAGETNQAVASFKRLTAMQPALSMHQVRLGDASFAARDHDGARRAYQQALELEPGLFAALRGLVTVAIQDKRPQDGLAIAREVQKTQPKDALGHLLEGDVEAGRSNWEAAAKAYRNALQREARTEHAIRLHVALSQTGRLAEADRLAAEWIHSHRKDAAFHFHLGDVAMAASQWAAAEGRYRTVLELQSNSALALNNIAWLMVKQSKPGAVAVAEKAVALQPENAAILDTLSAALAAEKQLPRAIEVQMRAVSLGQGDPRLKLGLARLYAQAGDKARARDELEALARLGERFAEQAEVAQLLKAL